MAVILLYSASMGIITPANIIQLRQAVVRNVLNRTFERVSGCIPDPLLLSGQRAVLPAVPFERVIVPLFAHQVIAVVVIPAALRRALGILLTTVDVMTPENAYLGFYVK